MTAVFFAFRLRHLPIFLCSGLISILFFTLCYFRSQQVSSLAVAAILLTAPTFVVILSALLWKDRITKRNWPRWCWPSWAAALWPASSTVP